MKNIGILSYLVEKGKVLVKTCYALFYTYFGGRDTKKVRKKWSRHPFPQNPKQNPKYVTVAINILMRIIKYS
jgi:hypothetical protein